MASPARAFALLVAIAVVVGACQAAQPGPSSSASRSAAASGSASTSLVDEGKKIFRFDTFGDEAFWSGALQLDRAILGDKNGGVGAGVDPTTALKVGLKVDLDALAPAVQQSIKDGKIPLNDPATTVALLKADAVVGVKATIGPDGSIARMGITCALCHSTVDDAFVPGIGHRLDGWPNRDLNVGAIVSLAPKLEPIASYLGVDVETVKKVLGSWGPGRYDAALFIDGKPFRPDGKTASVLIPPAYGLNGVALHTYEGWGDVPYWNAFVANTQMHGIGSLNDPRLDDATKFPLAAKNKLGHLSQPADKDQITPKLPALKAYQLSLEAPKPKAGSFDQARSDRGKALFNGRAQCSTCHTGARYTDAPKLHPAGDIGIDSFAADRSPDGKYRTTPLLGAGTRATQKGGFYHDGRYATLADVVGHYNDFLKLGLNDEEKKDLVEFLKGL